jgi:hypothetical protein
LARKSTIKNIYAVAVNRIAGLDTNDSTTLSNICSYRTPVLCETYKEDSSTKTTVGVNGTAEGPSPVCSYAPSEAHALVDQVAGSLSTNLTCPGSNAIKVGLKCVTGYDKCVKPCAPGMYGMKVMACVNGVYAEEGACLLPKDATVAANLAGSKVASETGSGQNSGNSCSTPWAWTPGAGDDAGKHCVCVYKPGAMNGITSWTVWDCQTQWW